MNCSTTAGPTKCTLRKFAAIFSLLFLFTACKEYKKTDSGLQYKFFTDVEGDSLKKGHFAKFHIKISTDKDSTLLNSFEDAEPIMLPVSDFPYKGSLEEGLTLMNPGDSALFLVAADSFFRYSMGAPLPDFIDTGSFLKVLVKMQAILSPDSMMAERQRIFLKLKADEDKQIQDYLSALNLSGTATESGLYHVLVKEGKGSSPAMGDSVTVHYKGTFMDGRVFDSSVERGKPFSFMRMPGGLIQGWIEGLGLMKKGGKSMFCIPSYLAYGPDGIPGAIPPNSILVFEVELLDFKPGMKMEMPSLPQMPQ